MPRIPRGGQIVTLQSAKQGAAALTDVHLSIYLSILPSTLTSSLLLEPNILHFYIFTYFLGKLGSSNLSARYIKLQLAVANGIMSPKQTQVKKYSSMEIQ